MSVALTLGVALLGYRFILCSDLRSEWAEAWLTMRRYNCPRLQKLVS